LPVLNQKAVELAVKTGLALNCRIREKSIFARKNYFYPDLPKGYQISQHDKPICEDGYLLFKMNGQERRIKITRAHLEEDAGKSTHQGDHTLLNFNRAGIPLLEIVSAPELTSAQEAAEYARTLRQIVRYLDVCDGNLEEGSMRCDVNVSVKKRGDPQLGTRVEIKNLNSFRFIEKAVEYEVDRQIDLLSSGQKVNQETRLYDPDKNRTWTMRTKEDAEDYRYFPDPDLLPLVLSESYIQSLKSTLPELPLRRVQRFVTEQGLPLEDAEVLTSEKELADFYERTSLVSGNSKASANWIMSELMRELNQSKFRILDSPVSAQALGQLIRLIDQQTISGKIAKQVFQEMWLTGQGPEAVIQAKGLSQVSDRAALEKLVDEVLSKNTQQAQEYRSGKTKVFGFFVGAVMKASKGQANPDLVNQLLMEKLKS
jgi:aspartyl-tRNA(Asn)/glutamyl-tRNA(Gln) amidotransferase subunit B